MDTGKNHISNRHTKSCIRWVIFVCLLLLIKTSHSQYQPTNRPIKLGVLVDNYPFSFRGEHGKMQGFAYELLAEIELVMGLRFERIIGNTQEINAAFREGNIDVLQSYARATHRDSTTAFSVPYLTMWGQIFVREDLKNITNLNDLKGRKVLVHRGSVGEQLLRKSGLDSSIVIVESVEKALVLISRGEGDATLASRLTGLSLINKHKLEHLSVVNTPIEGYKVEYCIAVQKQNHELLEQINEGLAILVRTGKFDYLYQKWFGFVEPVGYSTEQILLAIAFGLAIALLVAIWSYLRQLTLKNRIANQAKSLRESEEKYRTIYEHSNIAILLTAPDGSIFSANKFACTLFGYSEEEICHAGRELIVDTSDTRLDPFLTERKKTGHATGELSLKKHDGTKFPGEVISAIFIDSEGHERSTMFVKDLSEQKRTEKLIGTLSKTVEQSPNSIIITDEQGRIEFVNEKYKSFMQFELDEVKGLHPRILDPEEGLPEIAHSVSDAMHSGTVWKGEFQNFKKDGTAFWGNVVISPIMDENGNVSNFILIIEDISEKKQMLDDLIHAKEKAEESDRLKTTFLQNISHEIRTPMNSIIGFSESLNDPDLPTEMRKEFPSYIIQNSQQLLSIISNIIHIAAIESGHATVNASTTNINTLLRRMYHLYHAEAKRKQLLFQCTESPSNQLATIFSDEVMLNEILSNLLSNAFKYTEQGSISYGCKIMEDKAEFFIEDTGIGIEPKMHEEIFKQFRQVALSNNKLYGGSGLGLSIAKGYVELLAGTIGFTSEPGKGSRFFFTIPFAKTS
jgi:PAS domain S-box-containing protein